MKCSSTPCRFCPYRLDVPSGIWDAAHYEDLAEYDKPTGEQPRTWFGCHAKPGHVCTGWLNCGMKAPQGFELMGLRLLQSLEGFDPHNFQPTEPMFDTGTEARDHGLEDIECPGYDAQEAMDYLSKTKESKP